MRSFLIGIFGSLMSLKGLWMISALDSTIVVMMPLAVDISVVVLASRAHEMFWIVPLIASGGSVCGAAVTYYIGRRVGESGLAHFVSASRLARIRKKVQTKGAVAIAFLDLVPPPFPFTAFILGAGALKVSAYRFFIWLSLARLVRFGSEAVLAFYYGRPILNWFRSGTFEYVAAFLAGVALLGTTFGVIQLIRSTDGGRRPSHRPAA